MHNAPEKTASTIATLEGKEPWRRAEQLSGMMALCGDWIGRSSQVGAVMTGPNQAPKDRLSKPPRWYWAEALGGLRTERSVFTSLSSPDCFCFCYYYFYMPPHVIVTQVTGFFFFPSCGCKASTHCYLQGIRRVAFYAGSDHKLSAVGRFVWLTWFGPKSKANWPKLCIAPQCEAQHLSFVFPHPSFPTATTEQKTRALWLGPS